MVVANIAIKETSLDSLPAFQRYALITQLQGMLSDCARYDKREWALILVRTQRYLKSASVS